MRVGIGQDIHRLKAGGRLMVGGVCVSEAMSAEAHSDGDVAVHALVDAILGACGLGDIGEHFSNTDPQWRGVASSVFLERAVEMARGAGWKVQNADVTVLAEQPRLSKFKEEMRAKLSELCHAPVNIKAGTNEKCDAIGRGEAIGATAVVLMAGVGS